MQSFKKLASSQFKSQIEMKGFITKALLMHQKVTNIMWSSLVIIWSMNGHKHVKSVELICIYFQITRASIMIASKMRKNKLPKTPLNMYTWVWRPKRPKMSEVNIRYYPLYIWQHMNIYVSTILNHNLLTPPHQM